jgi:hypothetical protein
MIGSENGNSANIALELNIFHCAMGLAGLH